MSSPFRGSTGIAAWAALVVCCSLFIISCRAAWQTAVNPVSRAVDRCRASLHDPFYPEDHISITQAVAAGAVVEHRVKPATIAAGKRDLTLDDCRALALKNNLDIQVAGFEQMTKRALEFTNRSKLLPHLSVSGELSERNSIRYSYSDPMGLEGQPPSTSGSGAVNNWSVGTERSTLRGIAELSWSPTDAALAYYLSRSSTNDRLKAHYQRVRVAQKLLGVVETAYFRVLSLQQALPAARKLVQERYAVQRRVSELVNRQLAERSQTRKGRNRPPIDPKTAEVELIKARRLLNRLSNQLERQRNILASAMGLSPDYFAGGFRVIGNLSAPTAYTQMPALEMTAVRNRPEAYQAGLNHLSSINDLSRTVVKYFPKITGFWRCTADKDNYLLSKVWNEVGVRASVDILDILANYGESQAAKSNVAKTGREIATVALGITSQVRVDALKYLDAIDELRSAESAVRNFQKISETTDVKAKKDMATGLEVRKARGDVTEQQIRKIRSLGEANAALAELRGTLGTNYQEPVPVN